MSSKGPLVKALAELAGNAEQHSAVIERGHCVVLAGPGSGKTKTLTTAMARALIEDVVDPRGVACITYNNECAIELETRLAIFGVNSNERNFIGTVHSFALMHVLTPYARCFPGLLPAGFQVATAADQRAAVKIAYESTINEERFDPQDRWAFAAEKRRRDVDRSRPEWRGTNPELADFIEAYEAELRRHCLIDFDDMPLIAFRIVRDNAWIRSALRARFQVLFVDEYQDLGHALHELVLLLCFEGGIRLFAVGDADQSIYGFTGANPELLRDLTTRTDIQTFKLKFNYRSGAKIIRASLGALGEERDYRGRDNAPKGEVRFYKVNGLLDTQAKEIATKIVPSLLERYSSQEIAVLYRAAWLGDKIAAAFEASATAFVRADGNALVKRSSRLARLIESCAKWASGGWREANPVFEILLRQALMQVFPGRCSEKEEQLVSRQLIAFLRSGLHSGESTHAWLLRLERELITSWKIISRNSQPEWDVCSEMIGRTMPADGKDLALNVFAGRIEGTGRVSLSTLHSAKGREFDAVVLFGMNANDIPSSRDRRTASGLREARRLFYVGVTRPRKELAIVFQKDNHSPWVYELYSRCQEK